MPRFEKSHVILLGANVVLVLSFLLTQALSQAPVQDIVRAKVIELVNDRGEMRAQLHVAANGAGELRLRANDGTLRVKFGATDDGAILLMMDRDSDPAIRLANEVSGPSLRWMKGGQDAGTLAPR